MLAEPREIVPAEKGELAVYDHGLKQIVIFSSKGEKIHAFGNVGGGPGEWSVMSGAADFNYLNGLFFAANRERFLFQLHDKHGNHLRSIPFPSYMNYSDKTWFSDHQLLVTTKGEDGALAVVLDLDANGDVLKRIGLPEAEPEERLSLEQERIAYSNEEIPETEKNAALAAKGEGGYYLFMNTLGELRHYSEEGELVLVQELPEEVLKPVFEFVATHNRNGPPHAVFPLRYAHRMLMKKGHIYLFMPRPHHEAPNLKSRVLVFDTDGKLIKHLVLEDPDNEAFLYDFTVAEDGDLYFIDIMNSQVLKASIPL